MTDFERSRHHRRKLAGHLAGFRRDRSGAMAVEFAIVAAPLLFMMFSIIELGMVFLLSATLENATSDTARSIRTGAAQAAGATATSIRNDICARLGWLQSQCQSNLSVDVRTYGSFTNPVAPQPIKDQGGVKVFDDTVLTYAPGKAGDIVMVRAYYRWKLLTPFLNGGLESLGGGVSVITAAAAFRNEPYQ